MQEISLVGAQITSPASYAIQISLGLKVYIEERVSNSRAPSTVAFFHV